MAEKKSTDIKYALIEMIKSNETKLVATSIVVGLFKGIKCEPADDNEASEAQVFILLEDKEKAVRALALDYYNIMSLERYDGREKSITFFRASKEDQEAAFEMAAEIVSLMHGAGRTVDSDDSLIDITTYTEIPTVYGTSVEHRSTSTSSAGVGNRKVSRSFQNNHVGTTYQKKEPEPLLFKRKGRKLAKETLIAMRDKVLRIAKGDYAPALPDIEGDDEDDAAAMSEDEYRAQYLCCG